MYESMNYYLLILFYAVVRCTKYRLVVFKLLILNVSWILHLVNLTAANLQSCHARSDIIPSMHHSIRHNNICNICNMEDRFTKAVRCNINGNSQGSMRIWEKEVYIFWRAWYYVHPSTQLFDIISLRSVWNLLCIAHHTILTVSTLRICLRVS